MLWPTKRGAAVLTVAALVVLSITAALAQTDVVTTTFCPVPGAATYAAELCKCKTLSKYCNPYCLGTYIECGGSDPASAVIKQCPEGTLFSFYTQECEALAPEAPGVCPGRNVSDVIDGNEDGNEVKACDVPFCLCDKLAPGKHSNQFDASLNSYVVCQFVPGLPTGVQSQLAAIVECPAGQIFSGASEKCEPAPADAPAFVRASPLACSGIECFCRGRKRGLFTNPWDSDRMSAIRCNSKGSATALLSAFEGQYFNGKRFVPVPAGGLPPACVLDAAGVRVTTRGLREAWEEMKADNSTPVVKPFPRGALPAGSGLLVPGSPLEGRPIDTGRKLQQTPLTPCPRADFQDGCGIYVGDVCEIQRGNPCIRQPDGRWLYWRCLLLRCAGQCPTMSMYTRLTAAECAYLGGRGVTIYITA